MKTIKAILLKPLNGEPIGSEKEFPEVDFQRLLARNAVKAAPAPKNKAESSPKNKRAPAPKNKSA